MNNSVSDLTGDFTINRSLEDGYHKNDTFSIMGPNRDPLVTVIPMTIMYSSLLITGTIGNIFTCAVIAGQKYMHTATNFYLFSLALSDLLLLLFGLPFEMVYLWKKYPYYFNESICVLRALTSETSTNASILTITAFTIERYVAICHPLTAHTNMSQLPKRAIKTVIVIWIIATLCAAPLAMQLGIVIQQTDGVDDLVTAQCTLKNPIPYTFEISTMTFFIIPLTVIIILYIRIGMQLKRRSLIRSTHQSNGVYKKETNELSLIERQRNNNGNNNNSSISHSHSQQQSSSTKRTATSKSSVVKMLASVVVAFFICYSPFHLQRIMAIYLPRDLSIHSNITTLYIIVTNISGITYYLSATLNPILYQVMSRKFRLALRDTFGHCGLCYQNARRVGSPDISISTTTNTMTYQR